MAKSEATIVIKKIKKGGHGGHHGGAWKVAYADFVTAMMCFFLVMWLMGSDEEIKAEIDHYFNHPNTPYNAGRDPASDTSRPRGENDGPGQGILRGLNGILEEQVQETSDRTWEVEHGNWRVKLEETLRQAGAYAVQSNGDLVKFALPDDSLFAQNTANLQPGATLILEQVVAAIKKYPGYFVVSSHTADRKLASEEFQTNWDISSAKSTVILRYLVEKHGFDPKKISAMGLADQRPLVNNIDEHSRQTNNRIEFALSRKPPVL